MTQETTEQYLISDAAKQVEVEAHVLRYWEEELKLPIQRNHLGHRFYTKEDIERFCMIRKWKEEGLQLKAIRNALNNSKTVVLPGTGAVKPGEKAEEEGRGTKMTGTTMTGSETLGAGKPEVQKPQGETVQTVIPAQTLIQAQAGDAEQNDDSDTGAQKKNTVRRIKGTVKGKGRKAKKNQQKVRLLMQNKEKNQAAGGEENAPKTDKEAVAGETVQTLEVLSEDEKNRKAARLQFLLTQMMKEAVRSNNEELLSNVQEMVVKEMDYQFRQQEEREQEREEKRRKREEEHFQKLDILLRSKSPQNAGKRKRSVFHG